MKKILTIILCTFLALSCCACAKYDKKASIYFELSDIPKTFDPQTAQSVSELIGVRNLFEGLTRKNEKGDIVLAAAKEYSFKNLTYTFIIKDDLSWNDGTPLTAYDFEFALKRAVSKKTNAPFVSRLFSIESAKEIFHTNADLSSLGVKAKNENTLEIKLSYDDKEFLNTLSTSIAMPCNEEFFNNCIGKYGLTKENTLCNGSYYLSRWNQENFKIKLSKNEEYSGDFIAKNAAVFLTRNSEETPLSLLENDDVDASFIECALEEDAKKSGLSTHSFENTCWVLTISDELPINIRKSLAYLSRSPQFESKLKNGFRSANSLFPAVYLKNHEFESEIYNYNLEQGKSLFFDSVEQLEEKKFPNDTYLSYYDSGYFKDALTAVVGHWQNNVGAYLNIEPVDTPDKLISQLKEQTKLLSVFPISTTNDNIDEYLKLFDFEYNGENLSDIQSTLISDFNIVPLAFSKTTISYNKNITNIVFDTENGYIDFSFVTKKK